MLFCTYYAKNYAGIMWTSLPPRLRNIAETNRHAICSILVYRQSLVWRCRPFPIFRGRGKGLAHSHWHSRSGLHPI